MHGCTCSGRSPPQPLFAWAPWSVEYALGNSAWARHLPVNGTVRFHGTLPRFNNARAADDGECCNERVRLECQAQHEMKQSQHPPVGSVQHTVRADAAPRVHCHKRTFTQYYAMLRLPTRACMSMCVRVHLDRTAAIRAPSDHLCAYMCTSIHLYMMYN